MTTVDLIAVAAAVATLGTMPVFAVVSRGRPMDADVARRGRTVLLGRWVRDWLMWVIAPIERALIAAHVSPDALNVLGAVFGLAAGVALSRGAFSAGGWLVSLGGVADVFDGRVARARGIASPYGAFLDSTLDRFAESFTFLGLILYFASSPLVVLAVGSAISGSLLVSYARARAESLGVSLNGGLMQRAERLVTLALAAIVDPIAESRGGWPKGTVISAAIVLIAIGTWGTACWRVVAGARALRKTP